MAHNDNPLNSSPSPTDDVSSDTRHPVITAFRRVLIRWGNWLQLGVRRWEATQPIHVRRRHVRIGMAVAVLVWLGWVVILLNQSPPKSGPTVSSLVRATASSVSHNVDSAYREARQVRQATQKQTRLSPRDSLSNQPVKSKK